MSDLNSVAGVEAELTFKEDAYESRRKALLAQWQKDRKHLRALLDVLKDRDAPPNTDSDTEE